MRLTRSGHAVTKMAAEAADIRLVEPTEHPDKTAARERVLDVLESEQITTLLQPIVQLRSRKIVGVEALSRFACTPLRAPNEWFAEAVEVGLGEELELLAMRSALALLDTLPTNIYLSVNISPTTVVNASLGICFWGTQWSRVVLEITEHAHVPDYAALKNALAPLKEAGARLAVDDAGAGFSSWRQILGVAPDIIKIDMAMTRYVAEDSAARAMVAALVSFARESGSVVVAEGIETKEQLRALIDLGVDYGQGYLLGRPTRPLDI